MTTSDPLQHVADTSRKSAARVESLGLEITQLRARLENLEGRLDGTHATFLASGDRIEALRAEVKSLGRLEAGLTQVQGELARETEARQRSGERDQAALQVRITAEADRLAREVGLLANRLEALEALPARLDSADRERQSAQRALTAIDARVDAVAAERAVFLEDLRRSDQRYQARQEELLSQLRDLEAEIGSWRARIEQQSETVREARSVAEHMGEVVAGLRQEHHATVEAERMFEARLEGMLNDVRRELADDLQRLRNDRSADWALLTRANEARDAAAAALSQVVDDAVKRLAVVEVDLPAGMAQQTKALAALRSDLATALGQWRVTLGDATAAVEAAVGQADAPAALEERRQTLRRALRAQRAAHEP